MNITDLKQQAIKALLNGKYENARDSFAEIHKQDPSDLRIFCKLAEMKEKTGDLSGAIANFSEIASRYAEEGAVAQAIAINKIILRLDPNRMDIQQKLQELSSERGEEWVVPADSAEAAGKSASPHGQSSSERFKSGFTDTPLLSLLSDEELNGFMDSLTLKEFAAEQVIYEEGGEGEFLYLIGMGAVRLQARLPNGKTHVFSHLQEGDFFGEHTFMSHLKHSNSAVAETDSDILMVDRATFNTWVSKYPEIMNTMEEFYNKRVLAKVLTLTPLFKGIEDDVCMELAKKFTVSRFLQGETIMRKGEQGDTFYLIRSGSVQVSVDKKDAPGRQVGLDQMGEGEFFGEISLLTDLPRTATIIASQDVELMELTREDFRAISTRFPSVRKVVESYRKERAQRTIKALSH